MSRSLPTLLQRLRCHKGGWMLLFAALIIKIATGTACLLDGPRVVSDLPSIGHTSTLGAVQADSSSADDGGVCFLGEAGGCHCACAHATALPMAAPVVAIVVGLPDVVSHLPAAPAPLFARSPLRPPIA